MDQASQERLAALIAVDPANWTADDTAFVRARRSYLTADQTAALNTVLEVANETPVSKDNDASKATDETAPASKRKK